MVDEILLDSDGRFEYYTDPADQEDQVQADQEDQYFQLLRSIDSKLGDMENDNIGNTKTFQDSVVSSGNDIVGLSDNSTFVISDNIIDKPINNYNTTESLLLFIVISIVIGCLAFIIKRSVFRWN